VERGQASIEMLGGVPALLLLAVVIAQLMVAGYTAVLAGTAAEAGALAIAGGGAPEAAARNAVPGWARAGARVTRGGGAVRVQMRPPSLLPWLARMPYVNATAAVAAPGRMPFGALSP
jgi:uncharacterized protein (UPF0333 family)